MIKEFFKTIFFSTIVFFILKTINSSTYIYHMYELTKNIPLIYILILAPIFEEYLFRGYIFSFLQTKTKYANLIQALLFSLLHINPIQIVYTFILGYYLGNIQKKYGIYYCIFLHIVFNLFNFLISNIF